MRLEIETIDASPALADQQAAGPSLPVNARTEPTLKEAVEAAQNGDRNTARVLLFKVTEAEPSNVDAWLWLASISEYPEELLGFLVKVLEIDPENQRARQWDRATRSLLAKTFVQRGKDAGSNGQNELAAQCFEEALEYDLSCESAWLGKSDISTSVEEKELCLARVVDINPGNRDALRSLNEISLNRSSAKLDAARVAAFAGDLPAAEQTLDSILAGDPENIPALRLRSQIAASFAAKLEVLQRLRRLDPNDTFARESYEYLTTEQSLAESAIREPSPVESDPASELDPSNLSPESPAEPIIPDYDLQELHDWHEETSEPIDLLQLSTELAGVEPNTDLTFRADDDLLEDLGSYAPAKFEELDGSETQYRSDRDEFETKQHLTCCPFCGGDNDPQVFSCGSCHAILSLSDIETLFSNSTADTETVDDAVTRMEAEWNLREFDEGELTLLGLGHFNLHNFEQGLAYLQEAASLNPNNVILAGQANAVAIRLDELRRQSEYHGALPKGKTILVVDDSATVRKLISSKLEKCGHNVICAVDGVDAMEIIENVVPDLVLLDIAMPRMDGYSVCKLIRANDTLRDVPVVMISGKDGFFDKVRGRMAGTTGYITKPFGPETLMRTLETYFVRGTANEFAELADVELHEG